MTPRTPIRARKPAKRAFRSMVGKDAPADVEKPQQPAESEPSPHFQEHAHERGATFRGRIPVGTDHIHTAGGISKAVQAITGVSGGKNSGISVEEHHVCRPDTPDWIRDPKQLDEFFSKRLEPQGGSSTWGMTHGLDFDKHGLTYGLDRAILVEHYLKNYTDKLIFDGNKDSFEKERRLLGRKERWTSSPEAVKQRRLHLENEREAIFNPKKWTKTSWRGIIVISRDSTLWDVKYVGIATRRQKAAASGIVEYWRYHDVHEETAAVVADGIFDSWDELVAHMARYGIEAGDVVEDDRPKIL